MKMFTTDFLPEICILTSFGSPHSIEIFTSINTETNKSNRLKHQIDVYVKHLQKNTKIGNIDVLNLFALSVLITLLLVTRVIKIEQKKIVVAVTSGKKYTTKCNTHVYTLIYTLKLWYLVSKTFFSLSKV